MIIIKKLFPMLVCILLLIGCGKKPMTNTPAADLLVTPQKILVTYGDGNKLTLTQKEIIEHIVTVLKNLNYEIINKPDSVGQNFTLEIERDLEYISTGFLKINNTYYKAKESSKILELDQYIVSLGKNKIPGLLGS
ncbi:hypothetical protein GE107_22500 [Cohnella sp. CFH 77786]|uniref:hypothetical protein n=1 Tax=Cohnella sp. CFH 77786 TaxID=2662265 RepID=UPI001C60E9EA|nr:hypothetical protein [Cohnella sp. CFH 77786]MBW5448815.1 hypothetical protein [Cohnella sp. CFH 77786]